MAHRTHYYTGNYTPLKLKRHKVAAAIRKWSIRSIAVILLGVIGFKIFFSPQLSEAGWYSASWKYRMRITFDHTKVSGGVDLTNYPALISMSNKAIIGQLQSTGNDLLFTSADGTTKLDHEIEKIDRTTGTLTAWVRIPTLSASVDTSIFMYYGNPSVGTQQNSTGVWDSDYKGVWHLNQANGASRTDSTSNANTLSENGTGGVGSTTGKIGPAASFTRASSQYLSRTNASVNGLGITGSITIEAWVYSNDIDDGSNNVIVSKEGASGNSGYSFRSPSSNLQFRLSSNGTATTTETNATALSSLTWHHFVGVYDGTTIKTYVDGNTGDTATAYSAGIFANTANFLVGARNTGSNLWDGLIDEVRVSATNRTAGWVVTTYNNESSPSTFYSTGTTETSPVILNWKFDEGTGSTINDASGGGHIGTSSSAPWVSEDLCRFGKCLQFNGSNSKVTRTYSNDSALDPATGDTSTSLWLRHGNSISAQETVLSRVDGSSVNGVGYKLYLKSTGVVCYGIDDTAGSFPADEACSTTVVTDSKWHFVEAVKSGTTSITIYLDGLQAGQKTSLTATGSISGSSTTLYAGIDGDGSSNPYNGFIDDIKIYASARTASQAKADFASVGMPRGAAQVAGVSSTDPLSNGLVGYWKMDESSWTNDCSTSTVLDSSGNSINGTSCPNSTGPTGGVAGKFANGGTFSGSNYILAPGSSIYKPTAALTVAVWFKTSSATGITDLISTNSTQNVGYDIELIGATGSIQFDIGIGSQQSVTSSGIAYNDNVWHQAIGTWNGSIQKLFIDGKLVSQRTITGSISYSGHTLIIAGSNSASPSKFFTGSLDDVRIYNRSLSDSEARVLYNWAPAPVGYWKFDEGSGTSAKDSSGNGVTGTLTGGPSWVPGKFGDALKFSASNNDHVALENSTALDLANSMTIEAWIYPTSYGESNQYGAIIGRTNFGGYEFEVINDGGGTGHQAGTDLNGAADISWQDNIITLNQWQHVAVTVDNTAARLYVNGVLILSSTSTVTQSYPLASVGATNAYIGNLDGTNDDFGGNIDELRVYNYARSPQQVVSDMNGDHAAVGSPISSSIAHWSFDEGYSTTAHDKSSFTNDLTLNSSSWTNSGAFNKAWNGTGALWLSRADDPDLDFESGDSFTISTWVRSDSSVNPSTAEYIVSKESSSAGYAIWFATTGEIICGIDDDATSFPEDSAGDTSANTDYYDATWHHIVCTRNTTTGALSLYIDGKLFDADSSLSATGSLANSDSYTMGSRNTTNDTDDLFGDIDETKVYRYALNSDQVKIEYNQGKSQVLGALSTASDGITKDNSSAREYCVPGDTSSCSSPIAQWHLDERTGTTVNDTSGTGNTGSWNGSGTHWAPGKYGSGGRFNGSNDYINNGSTAIINNQSAYTLCVWIKTTSTSTGKVYAEANSTDVGNYIYLSINESGASNKIQYAHGTGAGYSVLNSLSSINTGAWNYVCAVQNSTSSRSLYVNGIKEATDTTSTATMTLNRAALGAILTSGASQFYTGSADELKIYSYARSPAQIAWDYNRGGPVGYWKFDECTGTTAYDSSGNSNNGTITIDATIPYTSAGTCNSNTSTEAWNAGSTGKFGSALAFDGADDHVLVFPMNTLSATSGTVSVWVYPTVSSPSVDEMIVMANRETSRIYLRRAITTGNMVIRLGTDAEVNTGVNIPSGTWSHLAMTWDSGTYYAYINGKQVATGSFTALGALNGFSSIGSYDDNAGDINSYFSGLMDEVRMYTYAATATQLKAIMNQGFSVLYSPTSAP